MNPHFGLVPGLGDSRLADLDGVRAACRRAWLAEWRASRGLSRRPNFVPPPRDPRLWPAWARGEDVPGPRWERIEDVELRRRVEEGRRRRAREEAVEAPEKQPAGPWVEGARGWYRPHRRRDILPRWAVQRYPAAEVYLTPQWGWCASVHRVFGGTFGRDFESAEQARGWADWQITYAVRRGA